MATFLLLIPPLSPIYRCDEGWPRNVMILITVALAIFGQSGATLAILSDFVDGDGGEALFAVGILLFLPAALGALASQIAANLLMNVAPRK